MPRECRDIASNFKRALPVDLAAKNSCRESTLCGDSAGLQQSRNAPLIANEDVFKEVALCSEICSWEFVLEC